MGFFGDHPAFSSLPFLNKKYDRARFKKCLKTVSLLVMVDLVGCIKAPDTKKILVEEEEIRVEESIPVCETGAVESVWVPNVRASQGFSAGAGRKDQNVQVVNETQSRSVSMTGLSQAIDPNDANRVVSFQFSIPGDLGPSGALSLLGEVKQIPKTVTGEAYAFLVSLNDGNREWVQLQSACFTQGFFTCNGGVCSVNSQCTVGPNSVFSNRRDWEQSQRPSYGTTSTVSFPHCLSENAGSPACLFGTSILGPTKSLPFGTTYTAKYVVISDSYSSLSGKTATLELAIQKKMDFTGPDSINPGASSGAVDVNVFLVGNSVTQVGKTATGQRNLDRLLSRVMDVYSQNGTRIAFGEIKAYELDCTLGDTFAYGDLDDLGLLIKGGSGLLPTGRRENALNLFFVSQILDSDPNFSVLGISGALRGPAQSGFHSSGIVVSTFDQLTTINSGGPGACPNQCAEGAFVRLANTVAHEIGHYLGLNHLSERAGTTHDTVSDTPTCSNTDFIAGANYITGFSCRTDPSVFTDYDQSPPTQTTCQASCPGYNGVTTFCPLAKACQFNHLMWWTSTNYNSSSGQGDGTILSTESGKILNAHVLVQ